MRTARSRWRAGAAAGAVAVACVITAACGGSGSSSAVAGPAPFRGLSPVSAAPSAAKTTTSCVTQTLGRLTLAQRVGQLFLVAVNGDQAGSALTAAVDKYHFGSLLLTESAAGTTALAGRTAAMQRLASSANDGIRLYIAANQEGGEVQQLTGPGFATIPSELEQGTWPDSHLRADAVGWGKELRAAGVNLDLAPVMDVVPAASAVTNAPIGALDREYGASPAANGAHGAAFIAGMAAAGVSTVAKHFPGLGRVTGNTDFTADVTDTVTTADDPALNSFRAAVSAGVPVVMVALATYTKIDASQLAVFSPTVMRLLRDKLGFAGVIISDDLGDAANVQSVPAGSRAVRFLSAGGDLVTSQSVVPAEEMAAAVLARASGSAAFLATVNAAVRQVLTAKQVAGLLSC